MVDRLYQLARRLLSLAQDTHENKTGLKDSRNELISCLMLFAN